ncbi:MAG TPA: hypothetical protein VIX42_09940 [Edaphobacter sp.]
MKVMNVKAMVAKLMTVGLLAGAFALAAPVKADAQGFAVGVQVGSPYYNDYSRRDYYDHLRFERERREAFLRQQEWERREAFLRQREWEHRRGWERHEDWERHQRFFDGR